MELQQLKEWREKANNGTITQEELKEAIAFLRAGRVSACFATKAVKAKVNKQPLPNFDELLELLKGASYESTPP